MKKKYETPSFDCTAYTLADIIAVSEDEGQYNSSAWDGYFSNP